MAAVSYILNPSASLTFKGTAISSAQGWNFSEGGNVVANSGDGVKTMQASHLDDKSATITVTSTDVSLAKNSNFKAGQVGSLVVSGVEHDDGDSVAATTATFTFAESHLISVAPGVPTRGLSTIVFTFVAFSSTGGDIYATS
jgi:hypothetical protein